MNILGDKGAKEIKEICDRMFGPTATFNAPLAKIFGYLAGERDDLTQYKEIEMYLK